MNYGANGSACSVAPPLSPTLTVSYPSSSEAAQPGKSAVIDLEKQSHALNREEIVNVHYTDYGHDIQVQNRTSMTRWQQSLFRLRYARFKVRICLQYKALPFRHGRKINGKITEGTICRLEIF